MYSLSNNRARSVKVPFEFSNNLNLPSFVIEPRTYRTHGSIPLFVIVDSGPLDDDH